MAVNLSPIWGAGAQLLDNSGNVLSGGKIYTYAAGTTTPATTYTSSTGGTANSNPIILNSAGRVPYEIWLTDGTVYKFVLKDSNDVLIATYDNLTGINSNFVNFTNQQEIQTATAGQTIFNLVDMEYSPGTNSLTVFVDGVNQYGPGAQYAYVETDSNTVTFVSGLHEGASVKFTTSQLNSSSGVDAEQVSYVPPFTGSVATNVEDKLAQTVSVKDFGAVGDGVTDDTAAIQAATTNSNGKLVYFPAGNYLFNEPIVLPSDFGGLFGEGIQKTILTYTREQSVGEDRIDASAIILSNGTAAKFSDFSIVYTGTYYVPGSPLQGRVDGLLLIDCENILCERIEATGFNDNGIRFDSSAASVSGYKNTVSKCWLHHNMVAGCMLAWQDGFVFDDNYMAYNGHVDEGGTGYGISSLGNTIVRNSIFSNNVTDHNYRKGIDFHDGESLLVIGNQLIGDRLYAIGAFNEQYPMNSVVITDNIIECDPSFYLSSVTYDSYRPIAVQINPYADSGAEASIPNVSITNNVIKNIGCDDSTHTITGILVTVASSSGLVIDISNNQIRGDYVTDYISIVRQDPTPSLQINICENSFRTGPIYGHGIYVNPVDTGTTDNRGSLIVKNNSVNVSASSANPVIAVYPGFNEVRVEDNDIRCTTLTGRGIEVRDTATGKLWLFNNSITANTVTLSNVIYYGYTPMFSGNNTLNGVFLATPTRQSSTGGASRKIVVPLKSMTASALTSLVRVGQENAVSTYICKWSAYYEGTGPNSISMGGGLFTFIAGVSTTGQAAKSAITEQAIHGAHNTGGSDITVVWAVNTSVSTPYVYIIQATANINCSLYLEIEEISSLQTTLTTYNPVV